MLPTQMASKWIPLLKNEHTISHAYLDCSGSQSRHTAVLIWGKRSWNLGSWSIIFVAERALDSKRNTPSPNSWIPVVGAGVLRSSVRPRIMELSISRQTAQLYHLHSSSSKVVHPKSKQSSAMFQVCIWGAHWMESLCLLQLSFSGLKWLLWLANCYRGETSS